MRYQNIQGIVLRKNNFGENDQYVSIYSPTIGKIDAVAKGSRKICSPFSGHLEIFNICKFQIYKSTHNYIITQCETIQTFKPLKQDLQLSVLSFLLLEIFQKITPSDEHGEGLFNLLSQSLEKLNNKKKSFLIVESFKIKLLKIAGALPDISQCSNCHHKWKDTSSIYISDENHIVCNNCRTNTPCKSVIQFNLMKLINFIANSPYGQIEKITLSSAEKADLRKFSDIFLHTYINCELKSEKIAAQILF